MTLPKMEFSHLVAKYKERGRADERSPWTARLTVESIQRVRLIALDSTTHYTSLKHTTSHNIKTNGQTYEEGEAI
jgi:hypothetical protein